MEYIINFTWDDEAGVWIATNDDIPGLVLESGSYDALLERTRFAVPELLKLNAATTPVLSLTFRSPMCNTGPAHSIVRSTCP